MGRGGSGFPVGLGSGSSQGGAREPDSPGSISLNYIALKGPQKHLEPCPKIIDKITQLSATISNLVRNII